MPRCLRYRRELQRTDAPASMHSHPCFLCYLRAIGRRAGRMPVESEVRCRRTDIGRRTRRARTSHHSHTSIFRTCTSKVPCTHPQSVVTSPGSPPARHTCSLGPPTPRQCPEGKVAAAPAFVHRIEGGDHLLSEAIDYTPSTLGSLHLDPLPLCVLRFPPIQQQSAHCRCLYRYVVILLSLTRTPSRPSLSCRPPNPVPLA